ncbi:MAG: molybdenum cofactor guanylyltransferase [Spirochaetae bacterium HGW-Spirochaetae-1]|jgi:molybdopterin-guanine dinucleotide biosynthesis protein A|nr:MAG: molybdenum cofactor guanylyltransferase [Spirochaetae bacterium HGW-Spirochaetae-1]
MTLSYGVKKKESVTMTDTNITRAYIIAGGRSSRFGRDKSLYEFNGKPMIMHVYDALSPVFQEISIIADEGDKYSIPGVKVYPDIIPGLGPIGGVYSALCNCENGRAFVVPCDMPFLNSSLIAYMASIPPQYDVIVPMLDGHYQPLHAIYSTSCIKPIKQLIDAGKGKLIDFYNNAEIRVIGEDEITFYDDPYKVFRNINYTDDLH